MKKIISKVLTVICMVMLLTALPVETAFGANAAANVVIDDGASKVGEEVNVVINVSGTEKVTMVDMWVTYDPAVLEVVSGFDQGGGGKVRILNFSGDASYTLKFKALTAGSSEITLSSSQSIVSSNTTDAMELYVDSGLITVKSAVAASKINDLSALTVSPGTLTPAFSKDVLTYNITLTESCERLTISATAADPKATVSVWGSKMDPGDNTTKITVTAESGDQKVYTIYTKVPEVVTPQKKDIVVEMNGELYNIVSNFDEELLPEGYEAVDYNYKNTEIVVGKGLSNGKILFCVTDAATEVTEPEFVVYNEQDGTFSKLVLFTVAKSAYTVVENMENVPIPDGYTPSQYTLNDVTYNTWVETEKSSEYFIIYCTNINGVEAWYQYDILEGTMQRAFLNTAKVDEEVTVPTVEEPEKETVGEDEYTKLLEEHENYVKKTRLALGMMAFLLVAVIIIVVIFAIKSFKDSGAEGYDDEEEDEEEEEEVKTSKRTPVNKDDTDDITFLD